MPDLIRPNRLMVDDRFSVLGFTIRADAPVKWFEVALATDPQLFRADAKANRTPSNFYSSRAAGPLLIERGEAVYLIPAEVLARFIGGQKLYFALATFSDSNRGMVEIAGVPTESSPWIDIKSFTGRALRRVRGVPSRKGMNGGGYTNGGALEWAGDAVQTGMQPVGGSNNGATAPAAPTPNGQPAVAASALSRNGGRSKAVALEYDDGFGDAFWSQLQEPAGQTDESDEKGIEGPIPDHATTAASQSYSHPFEAPEYPQGSRFTPAAPGNYTAMSAPRAINRIVIHITDSRGISGPIGWFQNPQSQVSAHYVIGQDGEVVQMVHHNDKAWHARGANSDSIGIEHVAHSGWDTNTKQIEPHQILHPTDQEYCASAALVNWLCQQYGIPMDRQHIVGHAEASSATSHSLCPNSVWNWDYFMGLVTSASCYPRDSTVTQGMALNGGRARPFNTRNSNGYEAATRIARALNAPAIFHDVHLHAQPNKLACWAASMAMLVSFRQMRSLNPESLAQEVGRSLRTSYGWDMLEAVKDQYGFQNISLPSNASLYLTPQQWHEWLRDYGPLWVTTIGAPSHAIVVHGISGDMTPAGTTINILNPWDTTQSFDGDPVDFNPPNYGLAYSQTFEQFAADFGNLGLGDYGAWRVLYLPPSSAQSQSLGQTLHGRSRAMNDESFHVNWSDVQLVSQPTGMSCWAAAAAMVVGWRDRITIDPAEVARGAGQWAAYVDGLNPADVPTLARAWRLVMEPPQSYTVAGLRQMLETKGPLWVGAAVPTLHAIVVNGLYGDGTVDGTYVRIKDPWPPGQGSEYVMGLRQFIQEYEGAARDYPEVNIQILHASAGAESLGLGRQLNVARARPMAVVEIASAIVGAAMTRILDNEGDVSWELDQLRGLKHISDNPANAGSAPYRNATPIPVELWRENPIGDRISAEFEVRWQYNGSSLGNVEIYNIGTKDAAGWGLSVKANIMDDAQVYTTVPPSDARFAGIRVHFYYRFTRFIGSDFLGEVNITLHGNNTYSYADKWLQH